MPRTLAERLEDRSLDQALGDIDLVRVETHRPRHRTNLGSRLLDRRLDVFALQGVFDHLRAIWHGRYATERDAAVLPVGAVQREHGYNRYHGEIVHLAILQLRPGHLRACRRRGNEDLGQHLVGLEDVLGEHVLTRPVEILVEGHGALATWSGDPGLRVERQQRRGRV